MVNSCVACVQASHAGYSCVEPSFSVIMQASCFFSDLLSCTMPLYFAYAKGNLKKYNFKHQFTETKRDNQALHTEIFIDKYNSIISIAQHNKQVLITESIVLKRGRRFLYIQAARSCA